MSRAPSSRWVSVSGVTWTGGSSASVTAPPRRDRRRLPGVVRGSGQLGGRPRDEVALGLEGQHRGRGVEPDPADLVELVVVTGEVAADRIHQEVVDRLVDARPGLDERVLDRIEGSADPDLEPGLLLDLAEGGLLAALTGDRRALGQGPGPAVALSTAAADDEPRCARLVADDDAAGRRGGRGPQAGHGADAAPGRRTMPGRPDLAHSMTTSGPGRPLTRRRVTAGWIARQLARSRASDGTSGPCNVVARGACARNDPAGRRPSRRSRTRVEGRTNRAAGRAAYLAAMLWSMGGYGTGSGWACKAAASTPRIFVASSGASAPRASARSISRPAAATYSAITPGA